MRIFLTKFSIILFMFQFLALGIQPLYAVSTKMWTDLESSHSAKGKLENVTVHSSGSLTLSPQIKRLKEIPATYVWCLAANETGLILAGTGDPGSIFKITKDGNVVELFKTPELHVHTIAIGATGDIYAGTLPHGRIYKITTDGKGEMFCQLPDPYIWGLAIDGNGNLYAATGNNGVIYRIAKDGTPSIFFDSPYSNVLDLVIDNRDNVYAACEPGGVIYKIKPSGKASVLFDADEDEIHCLALDNENDILYAGTSSGTPAALPVSSRPTTPRIQPPPPIESFPYESVSLFLNNGISNGNHNGDPSAEKEYVGKETRRSPLPTKTNSVYRIDKDGRVRQVLSAKKAFVLCLKIDHNNDVLVGTGNKAKLFKIDNAKGEDSLLYNDFSASQILDILSFKDGRKYISTGNNAGIYQLSKGHAKTGSYESVVYDAGYISSWGALTWRDKTPPLTEIKLSTRTGNSKKPDITWSEWSREYKYKGEKIESPHARFIQYRAILTTSGPSITPTLNNVCIAYLPQNQPPTIKNIEVSNGNNSSNGKTDNGNGEKSKQNLTDAANTKEDESVFDIVVHGPKKLISWFSYDPNDDRLQFDLEYKSEDEKEWKTLKEDIKEKEEYDWVTKGLPDGLYQIKITVSDSLDNPVEMAFKEDNISNTFLVDNTSPTISEFKMAVDNVNMLIISGTARDDVCNISKIQYAVNSGDWNMAFPIDNIFDSKEEFFEIEIPIIDSEKLTIEINAEDAEGNIGSRDEIFIP